MQINWLYFPWRPNQMLEMPYCRNLRQTIEETPSEGLKVLETMSEEAIKKWATPPIPEDDIWPEEDQYLGYLLEKEEVIKKHVSNRQKKQENKSSSYKKKKAQIPSGLLDEVITFFVSYNEMKHDHMSDKEKLALKDFIDDTKKRLYHKIRGYRGLNSQVTTLIRLLNEKPAL